MTPEEEIELRQQIAEDIRTLAKPQGFEFLNSVVALLWIEKCAKRAEGTA